MKTIQRRSFGLRVWPAALLALAMPAYTPTATAGDGAAWAAGGLLAGHMLTRMHMRREAAVYSAGELQGASAVASAPAAPAHSATTTLEQKLSELNKLAAGGYITPAEYKAKKQALLNSL